VDYWPSYALHMNNAAAVADGSFWALTDQAILQVPVVTLADRAAGVRRALLHVMRAARAPVAATLRDARGLH
jgi:DNA helicase II / ATP-dependent DNA helicase PcrA